MPQNVIDNTVYSPQFTTLATAALESIVLNLEISYQRLSIGRPGIEVYNVVVTSNGVAVPLGDLLLTSAQIATLLPDTTTRGKNSRFFT